MHRTLRMCSVVCEFDTHWCETFQISYSAHTKVLQLIEVSTKTRHLEESQSLMPMQYMIATTSYGLLYIVHVQLNSNCFTVIIIIILID